MYNIVSQAEPYEWKKSWQRKQNIKWVLDKMDKVLQKRPKVVRFFGGCSSNFSSEPLVQCMAIINSFVPCSWTKDWPTCINFCGQVPKTNQIIQVQPNDSRHTYLNTGHRAQMTLNQCADSDPLFLFIIYTFQVTCEILQWKF